MSYCLMFCSLMKPKPHPDEPNGSCETSFEHFASHPPATLNAHCPASERKLARPEKLPTGTGLPDIRFSRLLSRRTNFDSDVKLLLSAVGFGSCVFSFGLMHFFRCSEFNAGE